MNYPTVEDFLEEFGIYPVEVDPSLALCRYTKKSGNSGPEVDISFSAVMRSFQVNLKVAGRELAVISSESVSSIELVRDASGAGVRVVFDVSGLVSEAIVMLEPEVSCRWWTLRNA